MACPLASARPTSIAISPKPSEPIVRPDIDWIPSYKVYRDRVERLASLGLDRPNTVPEGWPAQVDTERAWSGSDFKSEDDFSFQFSSEDLEEIHAGLIHFKSLPGNLGPDDVNQTTFPLPNLGPRLIEVAKAVHEGRGFTLLRGLEPDKYSNMDNILLYLGVTSYIAEKRGMQDFDGRMICKLHLSFFPRDMHMLTSTTVHIQAVVEDVKKHGSMPNSPYVARAQVRLPFHPCQGETKLTLSISALPH